MTQVPTPFRFQHNIDVSKITDVRVHHERLEEWMKVTGIDGLIVSAQDAYLSEYNTLANNQRFALSGFTGSTGDGIYLSTRLRKQLGVKQAFILFVDGRYHLQGDLETDSQLVSLVKLTLDETVEGSILNWLNTFDCKNVSIGFDSYRTSVKRASTINEIAVRRGFKTIGLMNHEISNALQLKGWSVNRDVFPLHQKYTGRTPGKNIADLNTYIKKMVGNAGTESRCCFITCAADDAAWILNARGYHTPFHSSFLACTFVIGSKIILFLPQGVHESKVTVPARGDGYSLIVVRESLDALRSELKNSAVESVFYNENTINAFLPQLANELWPKAKTFSQCLAVEFIRARKTEEEKQSLRDSFLRSSRAIAKTMRWVKENAAAAKNNVTSISEADLANQIAANYLAEGALELSFNTIAGTGEHGAIIHYGASSADCYVKSGDLVLLDSGAYYEPGLATDCTRVAWAGAPGQQPEAWQKDIYTTVLRSCISGMVSKFTAATSGKEIDARVRQVCQDKGYDYGHGTGHGVGIHVHEGGIRFSTASTYNCTPHAAVSMEPGIYLQGKGGVRIENVVLVTPVDESQGESSVCEFENLVFVGLDWDVIDVSQLTDSEKKYLREYEAKCQSLGTHVTKCPLL